MRTKKVLITDAERRKCLPIIRSLARKGVQVYGVSAKKMPLGTFSRYCEKTYLSPDYEKEPQAYLIYLQNLLEQQFDVLYALEEELIHLLLSHPEYWRDKIDGLYPALDAFKKAEDKWETIQAAKRCNVNVPVTYLPIGIDEVKKLEKTFPEGAVLKPRKGSGSRGIVFAESFADIITYFEGNTQNFGKVMVQERIPQEGPGLGGFVLLDENLEVKATFGHQRVREFPVNGGPSTLCKSYRNDRLIAESVALAQSLGLSGISMVEYKMNPKTGKPVLMEINPRFWGSLQLAIFAGVDFPYLYYQLSMGQQVEKVSDFKDNVFFRWLLPGDILHFLTNPNRFKLKPSFFSMNGKRTTYAIWDSSDIKPSIGICWEAIRKVISKN